jgi:hypothetical protein
VCAAFVRFPIPLVSVDVKARMEGFSVETTVEQTYQNTEDEAIETKYVFPLDGSSAVVRFEAEFEAGKVGLQSALAFCRAHQICALCKVVGTVKEKTEAKRVYRKAVSEGKQAALLEQ